MGRNKAWGIICMTTRSFGLHGLVALAKFSQNGNYGQNGGSEYISYNNSVRIVTGIMISCRTIQLCIRNIDIEISLSM